MSNLVLLLQASFIQMFLGLTSEERVAVLPLVPLRLGLPMVHELVRSMASRLVAGPWLAGAETKLMCHACHNVRAMYGPYYVGKL